MPARDDAQQLARELADLRREVRSQSRGSQAALRSIEVGGETVSLPEVVTRADEAREWASTAVESANGKNAVTYAPGDPDTDGGTEGDIWWRLDPATGVVLAAWRWTGADWDSVTFGDGTFDSINVGKLVTGQIAAGQKIIAGPANGTHAEMSSTGFRVFAEDVADGVPNEVIRLGTDTNDFFGITDGADNLLAAVDETGRGSFRGLSVGDDPVIRGRTLSALMDERAKGLVAIGGRPVNSDSTFTEVGLFDVAFTAEAGRMYEFGVGGFYLYNDAADAEYGFRVHYKKGGSAPRISDPVALEWVAPPSPAGRFQKASLTQAFDLADPLVPAETVRLLLTLWNTQAIAAGSRVVAPPGSAYLWVKDIGRVLPYTQVINDGSPTASAPVVQRYTVDIGCSWVEAYKGNNSIMTNNGGMGYQGQDPSGFNGNQKSFFGFPDMTGLLAGAVVEQVDLYMYANHWYNNSGGCAVVGAHGNLNPPGSWNGNNLATESANWPKPGERWIPLGVEGSIWSTQIQSGLIRGISIGPGATTNLVYYGRFDGPSSSRRPVLRITYRK